MMELPHSSSTIHHIETPWFLSNRRSQPDISHPFLRLPRPTQHRRAVLIRLFLLLPTQAAPARSAWMKMTIAMHASLGHVAPPAFVRPVVYGCARAIQLALFAANVWSHRILWLAPTVLCLSETQTRSGFRATMLDTEYAHFLRAVFARTTLRRWTSSFASCAGPSKNTGDLALPLLDNPDTLRALAIMVQRIRNGRVSERTRRHILASVLVAPENKDGEPRPITVCEALYKMAAFVALADVAAFAPTLLNWYQFAFQPGGSESAELLLKAATEHHFDFDTDAKNAYGEVDRAVMLTTLYNTPQLAPIWRMVDWAYSSPSEVSAATPASTPATPSACFYTASPSSRS
jgi:hypothetical protein